MDPEQLKQKHNQYKEEALTQLNGDEMGDPETWQKCLAHLKKEIDENIYGPFAANNKPIWQVNYWNHCTNWRVSLEIKILKYVNILR